MEKSAETPKQDEPEIQYKPTYSITSVICSIGVGICWYFRNVQGRQKLVSDGSGQWLMMDINVALRRAMLILAVIALLAGFKAVSTRCKFFDFLAFVISVIVCLTVGYIVYQMGGKGFWFAQ